MVSSEESLQHYSMLSELHSSMQNYKTVLTIKEIKWLAEILWLVQYEANCIS